MRQSALCDTHAKLFEEHEAPGSRSFFTEIIASISDIKFGKDGRYILSRDYMTLKPQYSYVDGDGTVPAESAQIDRRFGVGCRRVGLFLSLFVYMLDIYITDCIVFYCNICLMR